MADRIYRFKLSDIILAMEIEQFEELVNAALLNLPSEFKDKLENVDIVVEEWPSEEVGQGRLLLGLYQGLPQTQRGKFRQVIGDKITIYKGTIEWISKGNIETIKRLVADTVEHEIAHHFGISDARLNELKKEL